MAGPGRRSTGAHGPHPRACRVGKDLLSRGAPLAPSRCGRGEPDGGPRGQGAGPDQRWREDAAADAGVTVGLRRLGPQGLAIVLAGCSARVQHGLDERQANEIQTVLVERGFRARKVVEDGRPPTWAVEVEPSDAADAVRVLAEL